MLVTLLSQETRFTFHAEFWREDAGDDRWYENELCLESQGYLNVCPNNFHPLDTPILSDGAD